MSEIEVKVHFSCKYDELAKKYRIYTKCGKNIRYERLCVTSAMNCCLKGFQIENVEQVPEVDKQYFLSMGDHLIESLIILAKRGYEKEKREKKETKEDAN